jgi:hypothetical protein
MRVASACAMSIATAPVPIPRNWPVVESLACCGRNRATRIFPAWARSAILASVAVARIGRLGGDPADDEYPDKPPRMRWATYNRLMDRLVAADGVADERLLAARLLWDQTVQ